MKETTPQLDDVAVLIPAYNCHEDLERTLASINEIAPVFVLIVDDGSTLPISPRKHAGLTIEVVQLPLNVGVERARAIGIDELAARGFLYAATIDAGDLVVPQRLSKQRAFLALHPRVACIGTWAQVIFRDNLISFTLRPSGDPARLRRTRFARAPFINSSVMLDVKRVIEVGNYRDRYPAAEDLDMFLRLMEHYDCANLTELGVYYELNANGVSATKRRKQIHSTLALIIQYFDARNPYDWLGAAKAIAHFVTPYPLLHKLKPHLFGVRRPR